MNSNELKKCNDLERNSSTQEQTNFINAKTTKTRKNKLTVIVLVIILIIGFIILGNLINSSTKKTNDNYAVLREYMTSEQIQETFSIFKKCEIINYEIARDNLLDELDGDDTLGFRIKNPHYNAILYIKDGTVNSVRWSDKDFYRDGKVLDKISNYTITSSEKSSLIEQSKSTINNILTSPSTAKYSSNYNDWEISKDTNTIQIKSYVDSQNGFGAIVRSNFVITLIDSTITSLLFDGTEYIK